MSLSSCSVRENTGDASGASSSSPCSDGPQYTWDSVFPAEDVPAGYDVNANKNPPTCTNHCATDHYPAATYVAYPYEALPSGACTSDGELCSMRAKPRCPCINDVGFPLPEGGYSTFYCRCGGGQWHCARIKGAVIDAKGCMVQPSSPACTPQRGSADASTDG